MISGVAVTESSFDLWIKVMKDVQPNQPPTLFVTPSVRFSMILSVCVLRGHCLEARTCSKRNGARLSVT